MRSRGFIKRTSERRRSARQQLAQVPRLRHQLDPCIAIRAVDACRGDAGDHDHRDRRDDQERDRPAPRERERARVADELASADLEARTEQAEILGSDRSEEAEQEQEDQYL